ncbi:hypothetical protein OOJ09_30605 [Mesorhizobium qingshengii]|uniref:Uncharacterized protein n=1 Tax=Mesorhizobium qingshengii TaxID=1165689 RepID=A0ABT4R3X5_9HYPH|nr:hypothetical protein [Mesorhizobium qingshengii]MCZ8548535.1 hypothetical protein [Mesorhizobium qingshengii]
MILVFKLLSTPFLILCLTLLSRRFGPAVGGLLMGIPLVTGPVSVFTALENGAAFARHAAVGNLVGQVSTCIFCFVYARAARRFNCWVSMIAGVCAFFLATFVWNLASWTFAQAIGLLLAALLLLSFLTKPVNMEALAGIAPRWDLPARMIVSTGFVFLITLSTRYLGPQLSGLVAPFPVFVLVLAMFTHHQRGAPAAANLLRGVIVGSFSFAAFFTVVALALSDGWLPFAYAFATLSSMATTSAIYLGTRATPFFGATPLIGPVAVARLSPNILREDGSP